MVRFSLKIQFADIFFVMIHYVSRLTTQSSVSVLFSVLKYFFPVLIKKWFVDLKKMGIT